MKGMNAERNMRNYRLWLVAMNMSIYIVTDCETGETVLCPGLPSGFR